ncbi:MAG: GGDEF domain-containing protein [Mariprofundaceae bacterium]|nr:GGDEF domain-containing protein [Mariprofundaceae bacterium]
MKKRIKYTLLGMIILPVIGRIALHGTGLEDEPLRFLLPMLIGGTAGFLIGSATDRLQAESYTLLKAIIDTVPMRVYWKDRELRYLGCNPAFAQDAGESSPREIIGKRDCQLGWKEQAELYHANDRQIMDSGIASISREEQRTTADGRTIRVSSSRLPLHNAKNEMVGLLGIYKDITEQKQAEEKIRQMAYHDHLTGLPNRALFYDRLQQALAHAHRNRKPVALLILDLDHFKPINDELGHEYGDRALVEVAGRLLQCVRATDSVARIGGDEFAIILVDVDSEKAACKTAEKVIAAIGQPLMLKSSRYALGASIGICMALPDENDMEGMVSRADSAMYLAKESGKNRYCVAMQELSLLKS